MEEIVFGKIYIFFPQFLIMWVKVDERGRLYIPKSLRGKIGREAYLVEVGDGILIIPKPKDPIKELEKIGKKIPDKTIEEIRKDIVKQAMEELE